MNKIFNREYINKKIIRELIILLFCFISTALFSPHVEASTYYFINKHEEMTIGDEYARRIERKYPIIVDTEFAKTISRISYELKSTITNPRYDYRAKLLDDGNINAYSVPGGHIYVTLDMMRMLKTYDEVAFVIGHELGHDMNEHWMQSIEKQNRAQIAAILVGKAAKLNNSQIQLLMTLAWLDVKRGYGFQKEHEADRYGFEHAILAGYSPASGALFFHTLLTLESVPSKSNLSTKINNYLNPHPKTELRLEKQLEYMKQYSKGHVEIKGKSIYVDGKFLLSPSRNGRFDEYERTYYIAGNIVKEYHDSQLVVWWVDRDGKLRANDTVVFNPTVNDEDINTVLMRVKK
jgi:predicted Zn-dependent protease